jgi:hypothetical protein
MQQSAGVDPGNGTAAGADAFDVHRRKPSHVAAIGLPQPSFARPRYESASHKAHVVTRSSGIGDDCRVRLGIDARIVAPGDRRHGGAGIDGMDGCRRHGFGVHYAALRCHHEGATLKAGFAQLATETTEIGLHDRLERCVDAGRYRAPVLAQGRITR